MYGLSYLNIDILADENVFGKNCRGKIYLKILKNEKNN